MNDTNDEKLLPIGEPTLRFNPPATSVAPGVPSVKQQQWGVVISIAIIVLMVVVGAFYAWGQRLAQNPTPLTNDQPTVN